METQLNWSTTSNAINILTVPDLIAKIKKWKSPTKQNLFCYYNDFSLSRENNKTGYNLQPKKQLALK
jgi:hypothetical protein